jgi:hypothetical protein
MFFYGWGRKNLVRPISETQSVVLEYTYLHWMWLFRWSYKLRWNIATLTPQGWTSQPLSREEARADGIDRIARLNWWWRWSLPVCFGLFIAFFVFVLAIDPA